MTAAKGSPYNGAMNIIRLLLIALVVGLIYRLLRYLMRPKPTEQSSPAAKGGDMVRCAQCGLHVPVDEAIRGNRAVYCSEQHRHEVEG